MNLSYILQNRFLNMFRGAGSAISLLKREWDKVFRSWMQPCSTDPVLRFCEAVSRGVILIVLVPLVLDIPLSLFAFGLPSNPAMQSQRDLWPLLTGTMILILLRAATLLRKGRVELSTGLVMFTLLGGSTGIFWLTTFRSTLAILAFLLSFLIVGVIVPRRIVLIRALLVVFLVMSLSIAIQMGSLVDAHEIDDESFIGVLFDTTTFLFVEVLILYVVRGELDRHLYALHDARLQAEAANDAKSHFLAHMSHELQTPLTVIDMVLANLEEGTYKGGYPAPPEQLTLLSPARRNAVRLRDLIDNILEFSALGAEVDKPDVVESDMAFIERDLDDLRLVAQGKGLSLDLVMEPTAPDRVTCDVSKVRRILANLVNNAIKFTAQGQIKIIVSGKPEQWSISVEDTGIGIPSEYIEKIFQPFFQVESSASRSFQGVGLGLTIVRALCIQSGGQVAVSSLPGIGSKFVVTLPMSLATEVERDERGKV